MLLENAIAEELPSPQPSLKQLEMPPPPSSPRRHDSTPRLQPTATEKDKMIAASVGALLTSLTMTPFDVIKTRLQTAPSASARSSPFSVPPTPVPAPHLPSTHPFVQATHTPHPAPIASTSSALAPSAGEPRGGSSFFSRLSPSTPSVTRASLPASGAHGTLAIPFPPTSSSSASSAASFLIFPSSAASSAVPRPRPTAPPNTFLPLLSHILRTEGPSALWRGTSPTLMMSVPGQVIYMLGYDWGRRTAFAHPPRWGQSRQGDLSSFFTTIVPLTAGAGSRTVVAALLSPVELLRTQLQSQSEASAQGLVHLMKQLEWRTAWRGLGPTLWRDVPFSGIYWAGYEGIKRGLTGGRGLGESVSGKSVVSIRVNGVDKELGEFGVAFVSGAGSGMIAATLTNPFDVIKTRRQALPSGKEGSAASTRTLDVLRAIAREEGAAGWFRGLTPRLVKVGPACGLMIGCYEAISSVSSAKQASTSASSSMSE
ncbi:hypothetical protein JCM11641_007794 [Rhodosporidiobolus odoratus]